MSIYPDQKYLHDKALVELLTKALCEPAGISGSMFAISELEVNVDDEDVREVGLEIGFNPFQTDEGEVRPETGWFNFRLDKDSGEWSLLMGEDGDDESDITAAALYAVLYFSSAEPAAALTQQEAEPVEPYAYLRMLDGRAQISVGPICPPDRAGGYATPWGAVYLHPPKPAALPQPVAMNYPSAELELEWYSEWQQKPGHQEFSLQEYSHYAIGKACDWARASTPQPIASVPQDVEEWSGWACQYPDSMPRLYGAKTIAEVNFDPENGGRLLFLAEQHLPVDVEKWIFDNEVAYRFDVETPYYAIDSDRVRAFLAQRDAGCVRVPVEPTEAMLDAFCEWALEESETWKQSTQAQKDEARASISRCYRAMLTASKEGV